MDWTKQTQEMLKAWTETQTKMWDAWREGLQGTGRSAATDVWQKTLETWQKSVDDTFDAQAKLSKLWLDGLRSTRANPESMTEFSKQVEQMIQQMQQTQRRLWEGCFNALKGIDPRSSSGSWEEQAHQVFQHWQDIAQKAMEAQAELVAKFGKR